MTNVNRRQLLKAGAFAPLLSACGSISQQKQTVSALSADDIASLTQLPRRIKRDFFVDDYGAVADDKTDCTVAIANAIAAAAEAGGGRVVFGNGIYRSAAIHLKSRIELHVPRGAEISFSSQADAYLPPVFTRWEGMEMMGLSPFVYAFGAIDVSITGGGVLNGNANNEKWWPWKGAHKEAHWKLIPSQDQHKARRDLFDLAEKGTPVAQRLFAKDSFLRPVFVQFYQCQRVLVENITIKDAPFWLLHPVLCEDVTVRGVTFSSHGPNSDGCDPESCNRVVIEQCVFDTGDDCIAIKSGRNNDGRRINVPTTNVLVQDCQMHAGHGGVVIGSEISGGVQNLHVRRCKMDSPDLERAIRIKTNAQRGGVIKQLNYQDIHVGRVQEVIVINFFYEEGDKGEWLPLVDEISIKNLYVEHADRIFMLKGFYNDPIRKVNIDNMQIQHVDHLGVVENIAGLNLTNSRANGSDIDLKKVF